MTNIEKIYSLLEKAYFMEGISSDNKENESNLQDFETKFQVNIPLDYRWLLNNFGSCNFSDPYIYGITDLNRCYSHFMKKWNEYINLGYNMSECLSPFPIGGFGDGDNAVIDMNNEKILKFYHDYPPEDIPFEKITDNFTELMRIQAESVFWVHKQINSTAKK